MNRILIFLLACCSYASMGFGQITFGCRDMLGRPVGAVPNDSLRDVARAYIARNGPVIEYNRFVLYRLSQQSRLFWYGHECAHHARGHTLGTTHPLRQEQDADCYSIVTLVDAGLLSLSDVRIVQSEISSSSGDWLHLPGPQRAINLGRCLAEAGIGSTAGGSRGANSCGYAFDDECDEPDLCDPGTDTADCRPGSGQSGSFESCLERMDRGCMSDCQNNYGYSYRTCRFQMCNAPNQLALNRQRCW